VRAAIEAQGGGGRLRAVARAGTPHVLSTFSHASYKAAPELCLAAFDELKSLGLEAFTKKHDPYWDIPPNENASPARQSTLPIPEGAADELSPEEDDGTFNCSNKRSELTRSRKKR
jgi:hypothetical protein